MSQEKVEILKASIAAWNAGDMHAFRELYDPDIILRAIEGWPEPGPYVGREAVMREFEQMRETWDADVLEPISDFIHAADRIVVKDHLAWRRPRPGGEVGVHGRLHGAQGQDRLPGVLLGPRGSPRNPGPVGVGDVAGEAMTTRRHTRQMKCGRGDLPLIPTFVRERGGDRASVQERPGILRGGGPYF